MNQSVLAWKDGLIAPEKPANDFQQALVNFQTFDGYYFKQ